MIPLFKKYSSEKEKLGRQMSVDIWFYLSSKVVSFIRTREKQQNGRRDLVNYCLSCDRLNLTIENGTSCKIFGLERLNFVFMYSFLYFIVLTLCFDPV